MSLRRHHHNLASHRSFAVRFAYWNALVNGVLAVVFFGPVMAAQYLTPLGHSISWTNFLSVWALGATHAGAFIAAIAAYHAAEDNNRNQETP